MHAVELRQRGAAIRWSTSTCAEAASGEMYGADPTTLRRCRSTVRPLGEQRQGERAQAAKAAKAAQAAKAAMAKSKNRERRAHVLNVVTEVTSSPVESHQVVSGWRYRGRAARRARRRPQSRPPAELRTAMPGGRACNAAASSCTFPTRSSKRARAAAPRRTRGAASSRLTGRPRIESDVRRLHAQTDCEVRNCPGAILDSV